VRPAAQSPRADGASVLAQSHRHNPDVAASQHAAARQRRGCGVLRSHAAHATAPSAPLQRCVRYAIPLSTIRTCARGVRRRLCHRHGMRLAKFTWMAAPEVRLQSGVRPTAGSNGRLLRQVHSKAAARSTSASVSTGKSSLWRTSAPTTSHRHCLAAGMSGGSAVKASGSMGAIPDGSSRAVQGKGQPGSSIALRSFRMRRARSEMPRITSPGPPLSRPSPPVRRKGTMHY